VNGETLFIHTWPFREGCCSKPERTHVPVPLWSRDARALEQWRLRVLQVVHRHPLNDELPSRRILILVNPGVFSRPRSRFRLPADAWLCAACAQRRVRARRCPRTASWSPSLRRGRSATNPHHIATFG
jgi:hypothetical protein